MAKKKKKAAKKPARKVSKKTVKKASRSAKRSARQVAKRQPKAVKKKGTSRKAASRKASPKKVAAKRTATKKQPPKGEPAAASAPVPAGEMYREGNWKADQDYREGLKEFSEGHDAEELARHAAEELEEEEEGTPREGRAEREDDSEW